VTDPKAPRQPLPATDGADYLKTISGFSAIRNGGSNGDPVLRGMFGSRLAILADGGQLLGACPGRMDAPTAYIAPQSYDRLVVTKGPQSVQWGPGASAGTVRFARDPETFTQAGARADATLLAGSNGRIERRLDVAAGNQSAFARVLTNDASADDYRDGDGRAVPSRWRKWNSDLALGWTPSPDSLLELSAGKGDGNARYAGRGMDGARFSRESLRLRLERHGHRATLGAGMTMPPHPTADRQRATTLPSGFIRYEHDLQTLPLTAYAGLGHTWRFPDYWELYSATNGPDGSANAFEGIRPEKTTQLDTGLQYQGQHLDAWVSAYAGQVRDYILFDCPGGQSTARNISARIAGGEMGGAWPFNDRWKADATLAYAWGENRSDRTALAQMPPLETRLGLSHQKNHWSTAALWRVARAQHRTDIGRGNVVGKDYRNTPGFGVFSVNGAVRVNEQLKVSAGVDNLFGNTYAEHLNLAGNAGFGYPAGANRPINEPGRTLWTQLDLAFKAPARIAHETLL
jgi:outer membrane receptor protein involved in Fe transport